MLWPFAIKESVYRLNKLQIRAGGRSNKAAFFGIDDDQIDVSTFHTFGSPCFVLDAQLQSGLSAAPKWEPRSRLGIYVSHLPFERHDYGSRNWDDPQKDCQAQKYFPSTYHVSLVDSANIPGDPKANRKELPTKYARTMKLTQETV